MSLTDVVRNLARSVRDTFSDREKAKGLPFQMLQSALSGVGHALNFSDRLRKRLSGQEEQAKQPSVDEQLAENTRETAKESGKTPEGESRTARREPVIFAPRPSPEEKGGDKAAAATAEPATGPAKAAEPAAEPAEPAAKPVEPVAEPAEPAAKEEGESAKATAATPAAESGTEAGSAPKTEAEAETKTETKTETKAEAEAETKTETESATQAGPAVSDAPALAEPIPGYAELSLASLRARLRNKSADDIRALIAYEKATTNRANIVKMYENRLAKITSAE
ncbi:hypothetical protein [Thermostaphylospora chromogena]|uniref:Uncharacterized protein n=1 Tax=Thermostaphylospora chromogena TaxID=35622 RepID=A0A1H1B3Q7_9ACTN|nr:hypothetical protein [Thermostaphylospora chromogena]SDQ46575.1 hypothetical protein SAMN04489764_0785 [Thermostaphylospora chromogena]